MKLLWRAARLRHSGALSFVLFCFLKDLNHRLLFQSDAFETKEAGAAAWIHLWTTTGSYSEFTNNVSLSGCATVAAVFWELDNDSLSHSTDIRLNYFDFLGQFAHPISCQVLFLRRGSYSFISLFIKCFLLSGGRSLMDMSDGYMKPSIWFVRSW